MVAAGVGCSCSAAAARSGHGLDRPGPTERCDGDDAAPRADRRPRLCEEMGIYSMTIEIAFDMRRG